MLPTQAQLLLPLLETLRTLGPSTPKTVAEHIGNRLALSRESLASTVRVKSVPACNVFRRRLRWARQNAVMAGLVGGCRRGIWELTDRGSDRLWRCRDGMVLTVYETERGCALWADARAASGVIGDNSISLIFTSPPYPLATPREYGNAVGAEYLDWLQGLATDWKRVLTPEGSLVINLKDVWIKGSPTQSLYQEELLLRLCRQAGYHFCQRFYWRNTSALTTGHWVTVERVRVKAEVEQLFWLSRTPHPHANNRSVLRPYRERMHAYLAQGGDRRPKRPSGHGTCKKPFARDNGGAIPGNLLQVANARSNSRYHRGCRNAGLPLHPAIFPNQLPHFFIRLLTRLGETVWDPFFGSGTTGEEAEALGRRWVGSDNCLAYLAGARYRFDRVGVA